MSELFDFLRWALSDFWRFAGLAVLMGVVGCWVPSFKYERKTAGSASVTKTEVGQ